MERNISAVNTGGIDDTDIMDGKYKLVFYFSPRRRRYCAQNAGLIIDGLI